MSEQYERYLNLVRREVITTSEMVIKEDRFLKNELNIIKADIAMLFDNKQKQRFDQIVVGLEKYMQFKMDSKAISVKDYYNYIDFINKQAKNG